MQISELDPESSTNLGGLGLVNFDNKHIINTKALHPELQEIVGNGRVDICCLEPIKNQFLLIYAIYGYTNGDACTESAARTDDIIGLCLADSDLRPEGPRMIAGDLNASIGNRMVVHVPWLVARPHAYHGSASLKHSLQGWCGNTHPHRFCFVGVC